MGPDNRQQAPTRKCTRRCTFYILRCNQEVVNFKTEFSQRPGLYITREIEAQNLVRACICTSSASPCRLSYKEYTDGTIHTPGPSTQN